MRYDAKKERFEEIEVLGKPALFTSIRLIRESVADGLYYYEIRHDDEAKGDPVQIARGILVNHYGSILTREPIPLPANGYRDIEPETDFDFCGGAPMSMKDFLEKYPAVPGKDRPEEKHRANKKPERER